MEFINYTVDLIHKDGSISSGKISSVDGSKITLLDAIQSTQPNSKIASIEILNSNIADLKVTNLPPDLLDKLKKAKKKENKTSKTKYKKETGITELDDKKSVKDINMSADFDFAANLAMFDKKTVFEDFHKKDTIKPEHRLVGHNKVENVRKEQDKFRNDEMVLESKADNWDQIGNIDSKRDLRNASVTGRSTPVFDTSTGNVYKNYYLTNISTGNQIPVCSPIQLLDIERLASENFSYSTLLMAETFSSNLSSFITQKLLGGSSRLNPNNHNLPPLVLLLIGSERCSARAFAVGRHLTNHGVRVLAFIINKDMADETYLKEKEMFENVGGKSLSGTVSELLHILNHQLDTPVELIIDALQGYDDHLDDIFYESREQAIIEELISWCSEPRQLNKIMSFDIPSGIDGGSGSYLDNSLAISCRWCVSMGLPVAGILHAYRNEILRVNEDTETTHLLVDIGIPNTVYSRKSNLRRFEKIWYGAESVVKMNLVEKTD